MPLKCHLDSRLPQAPSFGTQVFSAAEVLAFPLEGILGAVELGSVPKGRRGSSRKAKVLDAIEAVFGPLARLLVAHGVSSPEAESLLRAVCVHEAANTEAGHRKKPNVSRVALLTGIDRAEVARILKVPPRVDPELQTRRHVNRVLAGWYSDRDFVDGKRPLPLPIKATEHTRPTFWTLVQRYAPGVYPGLILGELLRVRAVAKLDGGRVQVRMRRYRAGEFGDESLIQIGSRVRDLMRTMVNNATAPNLPQVCRAVETVDMDPKFLPLIRKMFADRSNAMLSGIQEALKSSRWRRTGHAGRGVRIGLTVFSHEEGREEHKSNETAKRVYESPKSWSKPRRLKDRRRPN
jgi:hypothetical protein